MRKAGLRGCLRARKKRTTRCDLYAAPRSRSREEELRRRGPEQDLDGGDKLRRHPGGLPLPSLLILDVYSRKVVGWSMAKHLRTELVVDALEMTSKEGGPGPD